MSQLQVTGEAKIRDLQGPVVANAGVITALDGAANQYVRGDGTLASFPTSGGGGSSVSYYLNGSVNQGTFAGSTYYEMGEDAITGTGTNFSTSTDGLLAQFITDAGVPDVTEIPSGNWNVEFFMGVSASSGALASFYVEIYKWDGSTFTLIATNAATPEFLTNTTTVDAYFTSVAMPTTTLAVTDRLAIRIYANVASKTVTLYTEDNRLCQVVTTFSKGMLSLNNLTDQSQYLTVGTTGTDFNIVSSGDTHTFNIPSASATNRGLITTGTQTIAGSKTFTGLNTFANDIIIDSGVSGNTLSFKQYSSGVTGGVGYTSLYAQGSDTLGINFGNIEEVLLSNSLLTTIRQYQFPDLSGTFALLEGSQTFTGDKTFYGITNFDSAVLFNALQNQFSNGLQIAKTNTILRSTGYMSISANAGTGSSIKFSDGNSTYDTLFNFDNTGNRNYTFPTLSGTLALLEGTQTFSGQKTFSNTITFSDYALMNIGVALAKTSGTPLYASTNGYANLQLVNAASVNSLYLNDGDTGKFTKLSFNNAADYTYTFPASSGTVALTSNIPTVSGASGQVTYFNGTSSVTGSNNFFWDATNNRLGIGLTNPQRALEIYSATADSHLRLSGSAPSVSLGEAITGSIYQAKFGLATANGQYASGAVAGDFVILSQTGATIFMTNATEKMRINTSGRLLLGTTTDNGSLLQVAGSATFTGALNGTSATFSGVVTAQQGVFRNSGVPAIQAIRDLNVVSVGTAGQGIEFGALNGTTPTAGAAIYGTLDNPATTGALVFQTLTGGSLTTKLTIASTGAATFSSSVTANNYVVSGGNNTTIFNSTSATTGWQQIAMNNTSGSLVMGVESNTAGTLATGTTAYASVLRNYTSTDFQIATSNIVRATITSGGNVGIGTSSPDDYGAGYKMLAINGSTAGILQLRSNDSGVINIVGTSSSADFEAFLNKAITFKTGTSTATERMRITSGGNVQLTNSNPTLDFVTNTTATTTMFSIVGAQYVGSAPYNSNILRANNSSNIAFETGGSERMRISSGGNVLIGTSSDYPYQGGAILRLKRDTNTGVNIQIDNQSNTANAAAHVIFSTNGNGWVIGMGSQYSNTGNTFYFSPDPSSTLNKVATLTTAGVWSTSGGGTSDLRTKQDIEYTFDNGIESILKLQPTKFKFKTAPDKQRRGFIAQDVLSVIPDLVLGDGDKENGIYGLDYDGILALAVKAIQEQQTQIEELKQLINNK